MDSERRAMAEFRITFRERCSRPAAARYSRLRRWSANRDWNQNHEGVSAEVL